MAVLTKLPVELLDKIIEIVILSERAPPTVTSSTEDGRLPVQLIPTRVDCLQSGSIGEQTVRYEKDKDQSNATALLLTCKWVHERTADAIQRLYPDGAKYKLDLMLVNEAGIWPTWLHVPVVAKKLQQVDVHLRIFGPRQSSAGMNIFRGGDGGPPKIYWGLYYILERFLRLGLAQVPRSLEDTTHGNRLYKNAVHMNDLDLIVDRITIEVSIGDTEQETYEDTVEDLRSWRDSHDVFRSLFQDDTESDERQRALQMHPKWLAGIVQGALASILGMSYHTSNYGALVYDRVGSFEVSCEGSEGQEMELGERLKPMSMSPEPGSEFYTKDTFGHLPGDCRLLSFWNWKYAAVQKRISCGMKMPDDISWPTYEAFVSWREAAERRRTVTDTWSYNCDGKRCFCNNQDLEAMLRASAGLL